MTIRLGFCGAGKWGRKLAESFRACGAEVGWFDRAHPTNQTEFGGATYKPWRWMIEESQVDAIIAVAPPGITTEVALACASAGKAVMATKPLFDHPETIRAPFYVDFWRLWSDVHQKMRQEGAFETSDYSLCGSGPLRSFPGALDYGPHVMAAMLDVEGFENGLEFGGATKHECAQGELYTSRFHSNMTGQTVFSTIGNGSEIGVRRIWWEPETPTHIGAQSKDEIMRAFCSAFLSDVSEGFVDTRLLSLSRDGMRLLREIRERAK